ncbi:flagellar hook-basal body complex protein [Bacillus safensis]|uniref:flagellar hook-basal body complex protein n=1 Tax=Bacillus safensis TaxID=561879 RepID=UPI00344E0CE9
MLRSMYSGVSGLKAFQTKLDVISNNVANVNTVSYKKDQVTFKDMMSQTLETASLNKNSKQIGLGVSVGAIYTKQAPNSLETTGRTLDVSIQGEGYFIVQKGADDTRTFTRAGNFYIGADGVLVNQDGVPIKGLARNNQTGEILPPFNNTILLESIMIPKPSDWDATSGEERPNVNIQSIGKDGTVYYTIVGDEGTLREAGPIVLATFNNPAGLDKIGGNLYRKTASSGDEQYDPNGDNKLRSGTLEMSNVDLSDEMTEMIISQRGFQSNARTLTTSDDVLAELMQLKR